LRRLRPPGSLLRARKLPIFADIAAFPDWRARRATLPRTRLERSLTEDASRAQTPASRSSRRPLLRRSCSAYDHFHAGLTTINAMDSSIVQKHQNGIENPNKHVSGRARRERQRLPSSLVIQNVPARLWPLSKGFSRPGHFRSTLATSSPEWLRHVRESDVSLRDNEDATEAA
jgi:hypothetical protein